MTLLNNNKYATAFCCVFLLLPLFAVSQEAANGEYQMLLDEIKLFQLYSDKELDSSLLDSAAYYAKQGERELALVFLEELLDEYSSENSQQFSIGEKTLSSSLSPLSFSIRTGIDYNNQEFETKTEAAGDDELLVDQVNKPYVGFLVTYLLTGDYSRGLSVNSLIRYDKENFNGYVNLEQKFLGVKANGLINVNYLFDTNKLYPDLTYKEISSRQSFEWVSGYRWRLNLNNILRFKEYQRPAETMPNFIRNTFDGYFIWQNTNYKAITFDMTNDYNESINFENNDYYEQIYNMRFDQWLGTNFINSISFGMRLNKFNYALLDSTIHNFSKELRFAPLGGFYLSPIVKFNMEYNYIYKSYREKTEQEPDYHYNYVDLKFIYSLQNYQITAGYRYEKKKYLLFSGSNNLYINEQNFYSNGIISGVDYQNISGWYISASAMYSWRIYPNAPGDDEFSLYYSRNVLNLFFMGQIPLTSKLNLSILVSYDNDKDKDYDINNMRSSYFTVELQYSLY